MYNSLLSYFFAQGNNPMLATIILTETPFQVLASAPNPDCNFAT